MQRRRVNERKARGSAPGPRQGALPPGPPPKAEPLESIHFVWGAGGGTEAKAIRCVGRNSAAYSAAALFRPTHRMAFASVPPPAPQTSEGFQGPLPLAGFQGAAPLGGVRGEALAFLSFTRLPRRPGAYIVAATSSASAQRGWAAWPGWRRQSPFPHRRHGSWSLCRKLRKPPRPWRPEPRRGSRRPGWARTAGASTRTPAVAPPAPLFRGFVSETSQAAPPLVARAAARIKAADRARTPGAAARALAVPPPAPLFMEFVTETSQAAPPLVARGAARIKAADRARTAGASARALAVPPPAPLFMEFVPETSLAAPPLRATAAAGASAGAPDVPPPAPLFRGFVSETSPAVPPGRTAPPPGQAPRGLGCMASCPGFARRAARSCDRISRLIIRARASAAFNGASAAASARACASSACRPRSTGGGGTVNRPRASRPDVRGACPRGTWPGSLPRGTWPGGRVLEICVVHLPPQFRYVIRPQPLRQRPRQPAQMAH